MKKIIKKLLFQLGYKISKRETPRLSYPNSLSKLDILKCISESKGILHIGAHKGGEANIYDFFGKDVIWVEANPSIFKILEENIYQYKQQQAFNVLLGDIDGKISKFYLSNNDNASSSIFKFDQNVTNQSLFPNRNLKMINEIDLKMLTLDSLVAKNNLIINNYKHWIIDVQGAELLVLKGAEKSLKFCESLLIEISTKIIYQGGVLWNEISEWLKQKGFYAKDNPSKFHSDILFLRRNN